MYPVVGLLVSLLWLPVDGQHFVHILETETEESALFTTESSFTEATYHGKTSLKAKELDWARLELDVQPHRVFELSFNPNMFAWSEGNFGGLERPEYKYTATLRDSAGLPSWMKYRYSPRHKAGFLYGVPPHGDIAKEIDVVAINKNTYEYGLLRLGINVTEDEASDHAAEFAVKLKIDNLNVVDMFDAHRLRNLKALFAKHLWTESESDLHLVYIASAVDLGFRRPLDPALKDGIVVYLGSGANFSQALFDLDQETAVLRGFPACPRDFKRTSVERHFRAKGFALDWCEFRLMTLNHETDSYREVGEKEIEEYDEDANASQETKDQIVSPKGNDTLDTPDEIEPFPRRDSLPVADLTLLYVQTLVPSLFILMLLFLLLGLVFCLRCPCALEDDEDTIAVMAASEDKWDGLTASFFLVLKDCVTCCNSVDKEKMKAVSLRSLDQDAAAGSNSRYQRASSVQRQTDTLRRLAQQRDVAQRLQTPAPSLQQQPPPGDQQATSAMNSGALIVTNPNFMSFGDGGPVLLLSDDGGCSPDEGDASFGGGDGGLLGRPIPPPYMSDVHVMRPNVVVEDDGTYLV